MIIFLRCVSCDKKFDFSKIRYRCDCGEVLEVERSDFLSLKGKISTKLFDTRWKSRQFPYQSGVWRYKEFLFPIDGKYIITRPEGNTNLYNVGKSISNKIGKFTNVDFLYLKHEGENPTGSFKDRGMTVGISYAKLLGVKAVACASTGNTSSSLASYAALAEIPCFVFLPKGRVSSSKLAQSIAYGATNIEIDGDFDEAMSIVEKICNQFHIYLLNSINPLRLEGQKTIVYELLQQLNWKIPNWVVLPGGNLGNASSLGRGLKDLKEVGIIDKFPRIAVIQAHGANPFYRSYKGDFKYRHTMNADTLASAIKIGNPVSFLRAKKAILETNGVVEEVTDQEILEAKKIIDTSGIGCEPASATCVAGIKKLVKKTIIKKSDVVVGVLTGHILKDPENILPSKEKFLRNVQGTTLPHIVSKLLA
ncbi:threonine synthase [Candidatus Gottesmanbacteria bacterium]|nr:threonine synthase [Candidatus Gottesmanbacteria bacterium]